MKRFSTILVLAVSAAFMGCKPGYVKASELQDAGQGPSECEASCQDLGMRMAAMVLVSNQLPACVCQPTAAGSAPPGTQQGASASASGYVVIAAAAAARQQQIQQQQQRRQQQQQTTTY